ncbi:MAG: ATP-binding protein, partial [Deltaproteobacteria bacterium]|nr:ATP-binding protein [Deltaproteobacteria bacterium]
WTLSYLSGPMTRDQIKALTMDKEKQQPGMGSVPDMMTAGPQKPFEPLQAATVPPALPPGVDTYYIPASGAGHGVVYYPGVMGRMDVHYANAKYKVETTETLALAAPLEDGPVALDWDGAMEIDPFTLETEPVSGGHFADLPAAASKAANYRKWNKDLLRWVRQNRPKLLLRSKRFGMTSQLGESEGEFRSRLAQTVREKRDLEVEKLRRKYNKRFTTLKDRLMRSEQAIDRESEQAKATKMQTAISFGTAILGAFLGRKAVSVTSASRVGTAMRSASRVKKEKMDVARAQERAEAIRLQLTELDERLQDDIDRIELSLDTDIEQLEEISIPPKSTNITLEAFGLTWMPFRKNAGGGLSPE